MNEAPVQEVLTKTSKDILRTLVYYDIFHYPLKLDEISKIAPVNENIIPELERLVNAGLVNKKEDFFLLRDEPSLVERRKQGNLEAERRMKKAWRISRLIGSFPFVRAVMVSGSLSKGFMDKDSDIDYFVITQPGRLWIARTFLILFKKIFLLNSRKNFCVNYFIDTENLEIPDKNIFTATEAVTLLPLYNAGIYHEFRSQNQWAWNYFPNFRVRDTSQCHPHKTRWLKWLGEKIYSGRIGNWLDGWFLKKTINRWKTKFPHFSEEKLEHAMRSRKNVSKHHPSDYQNMILNKYNQRLKDFEGKFNLRAGELNG